MTWTTIDPAGATQPVTMVLFAATVLALAYALGLFYRLAQLRRVEGLRIPAEGLDEDQEDQEDEEP